jgi:glycosyltransferase involved in cell wall biosynthesis
MSAGDPTVSVVLPVRDGAATITAALRSVLEQTFTSLEVIVVDDGSRDGTREIVERLVDARLTLAESAGRGIVAALNTGIELARGSLIARMDADDVSHQRRIELQVAWLQAHPGVDVVGTGFRALDDAGTEVAVVPTLIDDVAIRRQLHLQSPFGHGTVVMRKDLLRGVGYAGAHEYAEDYDLWRRLAVAGATFGNVPEPLYDYRLPSAQSGARRRTQRHSRNAVRRAVWASCELPAVDARDVSSRSLAYAAMGTSAYGKLLRAQYLAVEKRLAVACMGRRRFREAAMAAAGWYAAQR